MTRFRNNSHVKLGELLTENFSHASVSDVLKGAESQLCELHIIITESLLRW